MIEIRPRLHLPLFQLLSHKMGAQLQLRVDIKGTSEHWKDQDQKDPCPGEFRTGLLIHNVDDHTCLHYQNHAINIDHIILQDREQSGKGCQLQKDQQQDQRGPAEYHAQHALFCFFPCLYGNIVLHKTSFHCVPQEIPTLRKNR